MKTLLAIIMIAATCFLGSAQADIKADKQAAMAACAQDAATANCPTVQKGFFKCLRAYKKANSGFKFSDSCKAAMGTLRADKKAQKDSSASAPASAPASSDSNPPQ
ncbi:MAG: hypothetical protein PHU14_06895 [Methylovulum sp.]|nr:hypothetical protein [Methylovulum sp.]